MGMQNGRLYDIEADPSETYDLSEQYPDIRADLLSDYERYAEENGVISLPKDFDIYRQVTINTRAKAFQHQLPRLIAIGLTLFAIVLLIAVFVFRRRSRRASSTKADP